jgi:hypothetical protein
MLASSMAVMNTHTLILSQKLDGINQSFHYVILRTTQHSRHTMAIQYSNKTCGETPHPT